MWVVLCFGFELTIMLGLGFLRMICLSSLLFVDGCFIFRWLRFGCTVVGADVCI